MTQTKTLLVGTTKGLFRLSSEDGGAEWQMSGPHCDGWPINHAVGQEARIWAVGGGAWEGAGVWQSTDHGTTWNLSLLADGQRAEWIRNDPEAAEMFGATPQPPASFSGSIDALWSVKAVGDRIYVGAKPASLFVSDTAGADWAKVQSLNDHPSADSWAPGGAGLTLHTIVTDPDNPDTMWLGISAAGVFATEDGGATWERRNRLSNAETCAHHDHPAAPRDGDTGHCVHNIVRAAGDSHVLYQQNHHGVYRSRDGGRSWDDITDGLPSTFGFPIAVHPDAPGTIWTLPLNGDSAGRYPPDAAAAIWRSRDAGETWQACRTGLPQENCYFTVLRQAMSVDAGAGLYFGTNSGSIFASQDEGDTWHQIAAHLPTVLCVEAVN